MDGLYLSLYRVWPDCTTQPCYECAPTWMSDDYKTVWAYCEDSAIYVALRGMV
jgi:hypothetical protein